MILLPYIDLVQQNKYVIMDPHQPQAVSHPSFPKWIVLDYYTCPYIIWMLNAFLFATLSMAMF